MPTRRLFCALLLFLLLASITPVRALEGVTIQKAWVLIEATTYQPDGQMWERMEYRYDHLGRCIVAVEYGSDNAPRGGWHSQYDSRGNLISRTSFYEKNTMDYWYEWHYEYDPSDRLIKATLLNEDGSKANWTEYEYDSQSHLVKETHYYGHDGKAASTNEYLNDIYGQPLVVVRKTVPAANSWFIPNDSWDEYEYDPRGNLTRVAYNPGSDVNAWEEATYDDDGKCTKTLYYAQGELTHWTEYKYDQINVPAGYRTTPSKALAFIDDGQKVTYIPSYSLDYYLKNSVSTEYSPVLAQLAMAFSTAVYDEYFIRQSLRAHGFTRIQTQHYDTPLNYSKPAFAMAEKTTPSGNKVIAIIIRGSSSLSDWMTDAGIGLGHEHGGFSNARDTILIELSSFVTDIWSDPRITYFITGHSYGAATANLVGQSIGDEFGIDQSNTYVYTFATPNVTKVDRPLRNPEGQNDHIFNLCNIQDSITHLPTAVISRADWGKYGRTFWFSLPHPTGDSAHSALLYLDFFMQHQVPRITSSIGGNFSQSTASKFLVDGVLRLPEVNAQQVYRLTFEESKATISGKVERTGEPFPTWCLKLTQPLYILDYISREAIVCDKIYLYDSTDSLNGIPISQYDQTWVTLQGQLENYRGGGSVFLYGATHLE